MSRQEVRHFAKDTSKKLFGEEETIVMPVEDARYRYYQWLRSWFGMGEKVATNKCPFYQFMFWGTLLMIVTFPLFIFAYIIYGVTKVVGLVAPDVPTQFEQIKDENPFLFSILISFLASSITFLILLLFLENAIAWIGFVVHVIFATPVFILTILWEILYWIGGLLGLLFIWIWSLFVAVNWGFIGYVIGMGILYAVIVIGSFWLLYRLGIFLFNRGCFNVLIEKSCNYRDRRRAKRNKRIAEIKERARLAKIKQLEYEKEHWEEIQAQKLKRQQSDQKWSESVKKTFAPLMWVLNIFAQVVIAIFVAIWWVLKKVGEIFYVLWHMITSTVSNHCPPIDFIQSYEDEGELHFYSDGSASFEGKIKKLIISENVFPEGFKVRTKEKDYKKVKINYNLTISPSTDYMGRYGVYSINSIKYLPKPHKSRAKKVINPDEK